MREHSCDRVGVRREHPAENKPSFATKKAKELLRCMDHQSDVKSDEEGGCWVNNHHENFGKEVTEERTKQHKDACDGKHSGDHNTRTEFVKKTTSLCHVQWKETENKKKTWMGDCICFWKHGTCVHEMLVRDPEEWRTSVSLTQQKKSPRKKISAEKRKRESSGKENKMESCSAELEENKCIESGKGTLPPAKKRSPCAVGPVQNTEMGHSTSSTTVTQTTGHEHFFVTRKQKIRPPQCTFNQCQVAVQRPLGQTVSDTSLFTQCLGTAGAIGHNNMSCLLTNKNGHNIIFLTVPGSINSLTSRHRLHAKLLANPNNCQVKKKHRKINDDAKKNAPFTIRKRKKCKEECHFFSPLPRKTAHVPTAIMLAKTVAGASRIALASFRWILLS